MTSMQHGVTENQATCSESIRKTCAVQMVSPWCETRLSQLQWFSVQWALLFQVAVGLSLNVLRQLMPRFFQGITV